MKKLSIVVHTSLQQELADCLHSLNLGSFMFSHIEEHSVQLEQGVFLSAREKVADYVPKVRADVLLEEERARIFLDELRGSGVSFCGKGVYWIMEVNETGELS